MTARYLLGSVMPYGIRAILETRGEHGVPIAQVLLPIMGADATIEQRREARDVIATKIVAALNKLEGA